MLIGRAPARHLAAGKRPGRPHPVPALAPRAEHRHPAPPTERGGGSGGRFAQHVDQRCVRDARGGGQGSARFRRAQGPERSLPGAALQVSAASRSGFRSPTSSPPAAPASRIGDTLEQVLAESSSLPLGAIVMLSDGADNAGGIDLRHHRGDPAAAHSDPHHRLRQGASRQGCRDHRRRGARARPAGFQADRHGHAAELGPRGQQEQADGARERQGAGVAGRDASRTNGSSQTETLVFNGGTAGPKTLEISVDPVGGEENRSTTRSPAWSTWKRASRASSTSRASRCGSTSSSAARSTTTPISASNCRACCAPRRTRSTARASSDAKELEDGFPAKPEELFAYQGLIIGGVEASYFTRAAAAGDPAISSTGAAAACCSSPGAPAERRRLAEFAAGGPGAGAAAGWTRHVPSRFLQRVADRSRARRACSAGWTRIRRATPSAGRRCRRLPTTRTSARPSRAPPRCWKSLRRASARSRCW